MHLVKSAASGSLGCRRSIASRRNTLTTSSKLPDVRAATARLVRPFHPLANFHRGAARAFIRGRAEPSTSLINIFGLENQND
jgi:hypothetical protein